MFRLATLALCFFFGPAGLATAGQLPMVPLPAHAASAYPAPPVASHSVARAAYRAPAQAGCWQSYRPIYDKYAVAFCLGANGHGSYRVQGGGFDCRGQSRWSGDGVAVDYRMGVGTCGAQSDWSADRIRCQPAGGRGHNLSCTYTPVVAGHGPTHFTAFRQ